MRFNFGIVTLEGITETVTGPLFYYRDETNKKSLITGSLIGEIEMQGLGAKFSWSTPRYRNNRNN